MSTYWKYRRLNYMRSIEEHKRIDAVVSQLAALRPSDPKLARRVKAAVRNWRIVRHERGFAGWNRRLTVKSAIWRLAEELAKPVKTNEAAT